MLTGATVVASGEGGGGEGRGEGRGVRITASDLSGFCPEWMEWWPKISLEYCHNCQKVHTYTTCKSGGYLPVSGGQLALVMAKVTTTNHCGQNTAVMDLVSPFN